MRRRASSRFQHRPLLSQASSAGFECRRAKNTGKDALGRLTLDGPVECVRNDWQDLDRVGPFDRDVNASARDLTRWICNRIVRTPDSRKARHSATLKIVQTAKEICFSKTIFDTTATFGN